MTGGRTVGVPIFVEWEDDFLVTAGGCRILTPLDRTLRVVGV